MREPISNVSIDNTGSFLPGITKHDRRRHQRVKVNLLGRYMLESREEFACQIVNMSPGGAALICPIIGRIGEHVIGYVDHLGRVEGVVKRHMPGGFAMSIEGSLRRRDKLAAQLTWLANRNVLNLAEDRRHERFVPRNPKSTLTMPDGRVLDCLIIDVSLSGAGLRIAERPPVGSLVTFDRLRARVVRHLENGIAIEFSTIQTPQALQQHLA